MSDKDRFDGYGYPEDYEPHEEELSEYQMAKLDLIWNADTLLFCTHDNPPYRDKDIALIVFDHPDHEGGLCIPIRLGELELYRAVRDGKGWYMQEDVGLFEELPDWVHHEPADSEDDSK